MPMKMFDASSLKSYEECPRKYYWRYVQDLVPKDPHPALNFGTAIHNALYLWYSGADIKEAINGFHEVFEQSVDDSLRTRERGQDLLLRYFGEHPSEPWDFISPPEQKFLLDIAGHSFAGRFDGVIKWGSMYLILDHKTATRMGPTYFLQYRPDLQMTAYCYAARKLYDVDISGALINVLYFLKTKTEFIREITSREPFEYAEFINIITRSMNEIKALPQDDHNLWHPRWTSCTRWGACKYRDLCLTDEPERLFDIAYDREEWDPLAD